MPYVTSEHLTADSAANAFRLPIFLGPIVDAGLDQRNIRHPGGSGTTLPVMLRRPKIVFDPFIMKRTPGERCLLFDDGVQTTDTQVELLKACLGSDILVIILPATLIAIIRPMYAEFGREMQRRFAMPQGYR